MTTKNRKSKQAPPSRLRYEAANPTVSVRISREFHKELEDLKEMADLSMADILKAGLDRLKPDTEASYERGLKDGYEVAEEEFRVTWKHLVAALLQRSFPTLRTKPPSHRDTFLKSDMSDK